MTLALWMGGISLLGAILMFWLMTALQNIERRPWW
jgi:hypothetical protein